MDAAFAKWVSGHTFVTVFGKICGHFFGRMSNVPSSPAETGRQDELASEKIGRIAMAEIQREIRKSRIDCPDAFMDFFSKEPLFLFASHSGLCPRERPRRRKGLFEPIEQSSDIGQSSSRPI